MNWKETALQMGLTVGNELVTGFFVDLFETIQKNNTPGIFENCVRTTYYNMFMLDSAAKKTKTPIDDYLVNDIIAAVQITAKLHTITL